MFVSYAQNFEDIILNRALKEVENGFYIDIGANDPVIDSVTEAFYQKGWRGVNVEPMPAYAQKLRDHRGRDIIIEAAVTHDSGPVELYEIEGTGLTTAIEEHARRHEQSGFPAPSLIKADSKTLAEIFDLADGSDIHFLKIDVEGMEKDVLLSWQDHQARPWILLLESTLPNLTVSNHEEWESEVLKRGYRFAYFDGLNRFYVHQDQKELLGCFGPGPNVFDDFRLSPHSVFIDDTIAQALESRDDAAALFEIVRVQAEVFHRSQKEALLAQAAEASDSRVRLDNALNEARNHIAALAGQLEQVHHDYAVLEGKKEKESKEHLAKLKSIEVERDEQVAALEEKIVIEKQTAAKALSEAEAKAHSEAEVLREQAAHFRQERDIEYAEKVKLCETFDELQERFDALALRASNAESAIVKMRNSTSWRASAPLRWTGLAVRKMVQPVKPAIRPLLGAGLRVVRATPVLKKPILAFASLSPALRAKIDHFVEVRPPKPKTRAGAEWGKDPERVTDVSEERKLNVYLAMPGDQAALEILNRHDAPRYAYPAAQRALQDILSSRPANVKH